MKTQYYKTKDFQISSRCLQDVRVGFVLNFDNVEIEEIINALEAHVISNCGIITTKSYVIFQIKTNSDYAISKTKSLKNIRKAAGMGGIIFRKDFYDKQHSTCTAQKIINENRVNENQFGYDTYICVHNNKLVVEEIIKKTDISLKLENIEGIKIDDLQKARRKEIKSRLEQIF